MKNLISNDEYAIAINRYIAEIDIMRKKTISLTAEIIYDILLEEDFFFTSAVDRSMALLDGIKVMLEMRNLACIGLLLRAQIDNCMRLYAAYIAEDKNLLIKTFLAGKPINKLNDNHGQKMTDLELRKRLSEYDPTVNDIYCNASGYVHLSDKAMYSSLSTEKFEKYDVGISVGLPLKESANVILLETAEAFIHYLHLQYKLLMPVAESKKRFGKK